MDAFIFTLIIVGLIVAALSMRRRHQSQHPRSRLAGSANFVDRDVQRLREDLRAL